MDGRIVISDSLLPVSFATSRAPNGQWNARSVQLKSPRESDRELDPFKMIDRE